MDKKKSILNVAISVSFKLATMIVAILVRKYLIQICGNDVNGLNSLYLSIIGFLSVAELGAGSAITFCMYRPIVERDHQKVAALYQLFRKWYMAVGAIMLVCGLGLTPFLHLFAKDYAQLNVDLYSTFVLMLVSVVLTYLFGAKTALINAYKNNYITTAINSGGILLQYFMQILVLHKVGTFSAYLLCRTGAVLVQWCVTEWITRKMHGSIISINEKLDSDTKKELSGNIRAMFMHQIGYTLVNTVDSVIISAFVGVIALGKYANYTALLSSMTAVIKLFFSSLTSVFGHLYVEKNRQTVCRYCEAFHLLNFVIGMVFYLGYYSVADNLVTILFAENLTVEKSVSMVIALNGFVQFMRQSTLSFRDATGTFYYDRWKPLVEGVVNIVLSVFFVRKIGVAGVILATVLTGLLICHVVEPYVLYRHAFHRSPVRHYIRNYSMIAAFVLAMFVMDHFLVSCNSQLKELLFNGSLSVAVSVLTCALMLPMEMKRAAVLFQKRKER